MLTKIRNAWAAAGDLVAMLDAFHRCDLDALADICERSKPYSSRYDWRTVMPACIPAGE